MLYPRLLTIPDDLQASAFLFGPRGTGKTSWLKNHLQEVIYYDLLDDEIYTRLLAWPKRIAEDTPNDFKGWIVIDCKTPNLI